MKLSRLQIDEIAGMITMYGSQGHFVTSVLHTWQIADADNKIYLQEVVEKIILKYNLIEEANRLAMRHAKTNDNLK